MKKLLGVLLSIALLIPALVQADPTVDLRYAIDNGDVQGVKNAISQNASVNANSPYGDSIIAWARKKGNQEIVSLLQERINFLAKKQGHRF